MSKVQAKLTADDVTLSPRIGEYGLYRTATDEYVRKFRNGFRTIPFYESCLTVEDYPARTDIGVSYIAVVRFHIGPSGSYIEARLETRKHRYLGPADQVQTKDPQNWPADCHVSLLDDFRFYGTDEERERTDRYVLRELRRFQVERNKPDHGAVRGVTAHAPIRCVSYHFCQDSQKYFCDFGVKFHPDLAALVVPCGFHGIQPPIGEGYWDCDLAPRIGDTPEERRPTEQRLLAALFDRLEEDALKEDENRDADEWQRIQEYRAEVKQATGQKITPAEARRALGLSCIGADHQEDVAE